MPYQEDARKILFLFLDRLLKQENKEFVLLAKQWGVVEDELGSLIQQLAEKENLSEDQLYKLALYKQFEAEAKRQIINYTNIAAGVISDNQKVFGKAGIEATQQMIGLQVKFFNKLPTEAINNFIGKSFYTGSKLNETLFANSYPQYLEKVKDELVKGIALGRNPRDVARRIRNESTAPLWQALRLSRTESMNLFRETSIMQMEKSGVCAGFTRIEQDDACDECQEVNGKKYDFGEEYDSFHPNCRGTFLPLIK